MRIKCEDYEKTSIVNLQGDFNADHVDAFRRHITDRIARGVRDFVVQAPEMTFIDSAGLESLLWLQDAAAEHLGQVRLVQPDPNVRKILEITRLQHQIDTYEDVTEAIRSLR